MITILKAAIDAQKEIIKNLKKETHPQLVQDRILAEGRLEAFHAVLEYQQRRKALLISLAEKR